ncbi:MAG TPA: hypothetical protein VFG69_12130 [Nannocystaceae bacterium]|nr:hypothetical protein [Nannocystaceae bacterium]
MRRRSIAIALVAVVLLLAGGGAWLLRVEDIPDELPPVQGDPAACTIPPLFDEPPLQLGALAGKTAFFVVVGAQTGDSDEGEALDRALNRWVYPDTTVGYIIGDAEGFSVFRDRIAKIMQHFGAEMRYPLYVDFEGSFMRTFQLPKGHHGFVVLGSDGSVLMSKSGGIEEEELAEVRELLGAREPDPGPPAPAVVVGSLDTTSCTEGRSCVLVFLGRAVARKDIPYIDDGFDGDDDENAAQIRDPAVRLVSTMMKMKLKETTGVAVGRITDVDLPTWERVDEAPDARTAFGLGPTDSAIIVITDGRVEVREVGLVRLHRWGRIADLCGVDINDRKPAKDE